MLCESGADADFTRAKTELIKLRLREHQNELIELPEAEEMVAALMGLFVTELDGLPARLFRDLPGRRNAEKVFFDARTRIADECQRRAAKLGGEVVIR